MPLLSSIRATNAAFSHLISPAPVAVFIGGTAGIGEGMARAFAAHTKGNSNIILVGRNKDAADRILASLPTPETAGSSPPALARDFIQCDATLMKNVQTAAQTIISKYPKINYLVLSTGYLTLAGRDESIEGIDKKLAVQYYARWHFIRELAPALKRAKDANEEGAVMNVFAAGKGGPIDVDDLGLKENYSVKSSALAAPTYTDLMLESFAIRYPTIPLIHAYPGIVRTSLLSSSPSALLRYSNYLLTTIFRPLTVSAADCAEYLWHGIYTSSAKPGAYRVGSDGEDLGKKNYHGNEEQRTRLWEHTEEVIEAALKT
jgi:NAD(P)-dependent dehydrogenase (short-subunit alcohol dehydrogenase family)